ncbi:hypothetical protein PS854_05284 [Pseudomonas fluorescens]|uniref:Uncharacterized protein n=1 Tax=Pseudomonas fluorescens TaxID=294 RepID=A0A5E7PLE6_PSEFL|nr:hypothetical protein PS854_05284 [Pseudomonas fluorescens]
MPAMASTQSTPIWANATRNRSALPQNLRRTHNFCPTRSLWELACQRWRQLSHQQTEPMPPTTGPHSHRICAVHIIYVRRGHCGSWLASDGVSSVHTDFGPMPPTTGPHSHRICAVHIIYVRRGHCGSWLASDGVSSVTINLSREPMPPTTGPHSHRIYAVHIIDVRSDHCGSWLASDGVSSVTSKLSQCHPQPVRTPTEFAPYT